MQNIKLKLHHYSRQIGSTTSSSIHFLLIFARTHEMHWMEGERGESRNHAERGSDHMVMLREFANGIMTFVSIF